MKQYQDLMRHILETGDQKEDRTGTGTKSVFGYQMRFNLRDGFPLLTTKKIHFKSVLHETLWFLSGSTNNNDLEKHGVSIWREWADANGDLGPIYGKQWRSWEGANGETIDQIDWVVKRLKTNPECRRLIVSSWNVTDIPKMVLAPCHALFQFNTRRISFSDRCIMAIMKGVIISDKIEGEEAKHEYLTKNGIPEYYLDLQLYQRSADVFLGVPFNIASYSLLLMMVANVNNMIPGHFIWTGGDTHLYLNHMDQVKEQLNRLERPLPILTFKRSPESIFDFKYEDFNLLHYNPHPPIKAPVAV